MLECNPKKRGRKPKNYISNAETITSIIDIKDDNKIELSNNEGLIKKKRGRKAKIFLEETKTEDSEIVNKELRELKKRGRKPKCKHPEELLPKVPKKRGRKPKDKYSVFGTEINNK